MPKAKMGNLTGVGTPRWINNRQKAKELQKLRWYCQMCQKSCRDQNGFKCHISSEAHQRQLLLFSENPGQFIDAYSQDFLEGYMGLLKREFSTKRCHANSVYKQYIGDRHHVHMNATVWETLTEFVQFLGRASYCKVEDTEKGWYITYIDRNPWDLTTKKRKGNTKDDTERQRDFIEGQVERGKDATVGGGEIELPVATDLKRKRNQDKIHLDLTFKSSRTSNGRVLNIPKGVEDAKDKMDALEDMVVGDTMGGKNVDDLKRKLMELEEFIKREKTKAVKKEDNPEPARPAPVAKVVFSDDDSEVEQPDEEEEDDVRTENWLQPDVIVKVMAKSLGDKYYKKKGYIKELVNKFTAIVIMNETGSRVKLDQSYLETVIPSIGRKVVLLNGKRRGSKAILRAINTDNFCGTVEIVSGRGEGEIFDAPYEDFSKLNTDDK